MRLNVVADANMPQVAELFSPVANVQLKAGRELTRADVLTADALLVRSVTKVDEALLQGTAVKFVGTATAGVDHIAASVRQHNTMGFSSAPGANARSVVEYDLACFSWLFRHHGWSVFGKRVGIIGYGHVGRCLASQLQALNIEHWVFDPLVDVPKEIAATDLLQLAECDCICVHAPITRNGPFATHNMLSSAFFQQLKAGAVLISAGRGGIVDEAAIKPFLLEEALLYCCDVWAGEPTIDGGLLPLTALATPHIAGYSSDSKLRATQQLLLAFCRYFDVALPNGADSLKHAKPLSLDATVNSEAMLFDAIAKAYPIDTDDDNFRKQTHQFDQLRATYWQRREFANYWVACDEANQRELLTQAGFQVSA